MSKIIFKSLFLVTILFAIGCNYSSSKDKTAEPNLGDSEVAGTPSYDKDQILFSFSFLADINSKLVGSEKELKEYANTSMNKIVSDGTFQQNMGKWDLAWGPVIYSNDCPSGSTNCVTDNTMVLLKRNGNFAAPEYVLAIAGTNPISAYGWFTEDFDVKNMYSWPNSSGHESDFSYFMSNLEQSDNCLGNCISKGTALGVKVLFNMKDSGGSTIVEYLKQNVSGSNEIAVSGHSLGGALAPTVALALKDYQSSWNSGGTVTISTSPYAGASPGNGDFKTYLRSNFTSTFYGRMNTLDMVPHAWEPSMMNEIASLYENNQGIGKPCVIRKLISCIEKQRSIGNDYTSLYNADEHFIGKYYPIPDAAIAAMCSTDSSKLFKKYKLAQEGLLCNIDDTYSCTSSKSGFPQTMRFLIEAAEQHTTGYIDHFAVQDVAAIIASYTSHKVDPADLTELMDDVAALIKGCSI